MKVTTIILNSYFLKRGRGGGRVGFLTGCTQDGGGGYSDGHCVQQGRRWEGGVNIVGKCVCN